MSDAPPGPVPAPPDPCPAWADGQHCFMERKVFSNDGPMSSIKACACGEAVGMTKHGEYLFFSMNPGARRG